MTFDLQAADLAIWNDRMQELVEPGEFTIMAGPNSEELKSTTLEVI